MRCTSVDAGCLTDDAASLGKWQHTHALVMHLITPKLRVRGRSRRIAPNALILRPFERFYIRVHTVSSLN